MGYSMHALHHALGTALRLYVQHTQAATSWHCHMRNQLLRTARTLSTLSCAARLHQAHLDPLQILLLSSSLQRVGARGPLPALHPAL